MTILTVAGSRCEKCEKTGVYLSFVAKMFNLGAWGAIMTYVNELLPTDVRSAGVSTVMLFGFLSSMLSPLLISVPISWLPLTVFATISFIAALGHWFLPDLSTVPMFASVEEGQRYYTSRKTTKNLAKIITSANST